MSDARVDYLKAYTAMLVHGLDYWAVPGLSPLRAQVEQVPLSHEQRQRLTRLDTDLIEAIIDPSDDEIPGELLQDNPTRPLAHWWWHLGKLRAGTYPAYLLPPHLRAIYRPTAQAAA